MSRRNLDTSDLVLHADGTALCSSPGGAIEAPQHGLFDADARILCRYRLTVDGNAPQLLSSAVLEADRWTACYVWPMPGGSAEGPRLPQDTLGICLERTVGPGMLEQITIVNHSACETTATLEIELASDLVDLLELGRLGQASEPLEPDWDARKNELHWTRVDERGKRPSHRGLRVRLEADGPAGWVDGRLHFDLALPAGGSWRAALHYDSLEEQTWRVFSSAHPRDAERTAWRATRTVVTSDPPLFGKVVDLAIEDLFALRNRDLERSQAEWVVNAGVPRFTGLFGRDVLTAGWQAALAGTQFLAGALDAVGSRQATEDDPWRDAQPGKLIHEQRRGPLTVSGQSPRDAYYGSQTVPAMFVLALSELWHWTGDDDLLRRHLPVAERATAWAESLGDADGDGFLEYISRSPQGLRNQGWKDSGEAIRYPDGQIVAPPIATVEEQAFHIVALERLAEIHLVLGEEAAADRELALAARHRAAWDAAFWDDDAGFYGMALDPDHKLVRSISSSPGHALGTGGVPRHRARQVAERLLAPDLYSGWGVRTLSTAHPSYNPYAYHLGAVWPVENATFALGCKRYGLDEAVERLVMGLVDAASASPAGRLPEALAGLSRDEWPDPVPYPGANVPQAWSASATIQLAQIITGLYPFAAADVLALVRPRLPAGVDWLRIERLRVGGATVSLEFERHADGSASHKVTERDGHLLVLEAPPPQAIDEDLGEAIGSWMIEHAPGRSARAIRIAMGLETSEPTAPPS